MASRVSYVRRFSARGDVFRVFFFLFAPPFFLASIRPHSPKRNLRERVTAIYNIVIPAAAEAAAAVAFFYRALFRNFATTATVAPRRSRFPDLSYFYAASTTRISVSPYCFQSFHERFSRSFVISLCSLL